MSIQRPIYKTNIARRGCLWISPMQVATNKCKLRYSGEYRVTNFTYIYKLIPSITKVYPKSNIPHMSTH
jgi:hypothetical protein